MSERLFTYSDDAVRELVLKLYPRVTAYIRGILGGGRFSDRAEDIFHDALCRFLDKRAPIPESKAAAYIYRAVRNACLNLKMRHSAENDSVSLDSIAASAWETLAAADIADRTSECGADGTTDIYDILAYSSKLPERTRQIFHMSRIEGMTHKEIADKLGISTRAVEKHLQNSVVEYRRHFGYTQRDDLKLS